nr:MAG TPA_asm: hypothetical protein [Caudoviricetes sp.]
MCNAYNTAILGKKTTGKHPRRAVWPWLGALLFAQVL